jgi:GntP family gluconate:H+ symporter
VLRQTGIAPAIENRFPLAEGGSGLLLVAFAITSIVRIAQGSATVAMITSVGIVAPLVANVELTFNSVYVALAIGCGSKPIPWMNDSGFWVVTRMSGLTESEALRTHSVALTIMGIVGLVVTLIGAQLWPLVS